jgi:hypothetical protein
MMDSDGLPSSRRLIQELAAAVGAGLPDRVSKNAIAAFTLNDDASVCFERSGGEKFCTLTCRTEDLPPDVREEHAALSVQMMRALGLLTLGAPLRLGATYVRRVTIRDGQRHDAFIEVG